MKNREAPDLGLTRVFSCILCLALLTGIAQAAASLKLNQNGHDAASVKPGPWSGQWWPQRNPQLPRVLEKYDRFVATRTGNNPGSADWERKNHQEDTDWSGHCNGWSAAACLETEPREIRVVDGLVFNIEEQKGLLTEQYMDCYCQFYGTRCNHEEPFDPDILPHHFHRLLLEYLKEKQIPFVIDADAGPQVWNHPAFAFKSSWTVNADKTQALVETRLFLADDRVPTATYIGTMVLTKDYKYTLDLNAAGEVIGGQWAPGTGKNHPDFVWVPTADSSGSFENPHIDPAMVRAIIHPGNLIPTPFSAGTPPGPRPFPTTFSFDLMEGHPESVSRAKMDPSIYDSVLKEAGMDPTELFQ